MFCMEMVAGQNLLEVWCETYDDVVLVRSLGNGSELMEFVQVKNEELDQLYSSAVLLARESGKEGSSIFERSLVRDNCTEQVRFRLVTSRQIQPGLKPLTYDRDDDSRKIGAMAFAAMRAEMQSKPAAAFLSPKNNGLDYWLERTLWETYAEQALNSANCIRLTKFLEDAAIPVYTDTTEELYQQLLGRVKSAAEASFVTNRAGKILKKDYLAHWLRERAAPLPTKGSDAKLREKLLPARQAEDAISTAIEMRRNYNQERRRPSYLNLDHSKLVTEKVRGVLHHLRGKLDAGDLPEGESFHGTCVEKVIAVKDDCEGVTPKPPEGLLLGCMYEIASRCRHRFVRSKP